MIGFLEQPNSSDPLKLFNHLKKYNSIELQRYEQLRKNNTDINSSSTDLNLYRPCTSAAIH
jgi:hypothetical protein